MYRWVLCVRRIVCVLVCGMCQRKSCVREGCIFRESYVSASAMCQIKIIMCPRGSCDCHKNVRVSQPHMTHVSRSLLYPEDLRVMAWAACVRELSFIMESCVCLWRLRVSGKSCVCREMLCVSLGIACVKEHDILHVSSGIECLKEQVHVSGSVVNLCVSLGTECVWQSKLRVSEMHPSSGTACVAHRTTFVKHRMTHIAKNCVCHGGLRARGQFACVTEDSREVCSHTSTSPHSKYFLLLLMLHTRPQAINISCATFVLFLREQNYLPRPVGTCFVCNWLCDWFECGLFPNAFYDYSNLL